MPYQYDKDGNVLFSRLEAEEHIALLRDHLFWIDRVSIPDDERQQLARWIEDSSALIVAYLRQGPPTE